MMNENPVKPFKVLIVEDDESSCHLLMHTFRKFTNDIITASTGWEGVESCRKNPDLDMILMDIQMPDMDGYEATRRIREFNAGVVIIAQTAFAFTGDREKAIDAGCNDYITKPIRRDELVSLIRSQSGK